MTRYQSSSGLAFLTDFWKKYYLQEYIAQGGSKIKFITGREGSGKTYALRQIRRDAEEEGYLTVSFSLKKLLLKDFQMFYLEILNHVDVTDLLRRCGNQAVRNRGNDPEKIPEGRTAMEYFSGGGWDPLLYRSYHDELATMFLSNANMDRSFATVCAMITAEYLGMNRPDMNARDLMLRWMHCDKEVKAKQLKPLGFMAQPITKINARHMLRSLAEVVRFAGYKGLCVLIDDVDALARPKGNEFVRYKKNQRDDIYEIIRQLIDDIDTMKYMFFVFAFERSLIDNEQTGFKSYQALWMRIQNEIRSERFNCFADIADLDRLAAQEYTKEYMQQVSEQFAKQAARKAHVLQEDEFAELLRQAKYGTVGLMKLIEEATLSGEGDNG